MKRNIDWIVVFVVYVGVLFSVYQFLTDRWKPDDTWNIGDYLTLAGTILLGLITANQTRKANITSDKLLEIEDARMKLQTRPFVMVVDWKIIPLEAEEIKNDPDEVFIQIADWSAQMPTLGIVLTFQNTTEAFLTLRYKNGSWLNKEKYYKREEFWDRSINQYKQKLFLSAGKSDKMTFFANEEFILKLIMRPITWTFLLENRFAERYKETFESLIVVAEKNDKTKNEWKSNIRFSEYNIIKTEDKTKWN